MKKIGNFFKKYGFYLATGVICIGALAAIFLMPNKEGNVKNQANPYAQNELTDANHLKDDTKTTDKNKDDIAIVDEDDLDNTDELEQPEAIQNEKTDESAAETKNVPANDQNTADEKVQASTDETAKNEAAATGETKTQTFESTTAESNNEPFFAEGDTFAWPVEGSVVVPYTDENTKHWFSQSLNQTMRTFGICISAAEGTEVKAVAKGTVKEVVEDSSSYLEAGMPYVGKLMIIDHGNGYTSLYGFQGGEVNEDLVGKVVNAGDVLGKVGSPKGAFIGEGDNIYLQVTHNDKVVNPLNYLDLSNQQAKADGVDLGFAK